MVLTIIMRIISSLYLQFYKIYALLSSIITNVFLIYKFRRFIDPFKLFAIKYSACRKY